jgi:hypothetical protein
MTKTEGRVSQFLDFAQGGHVTDAPYGWIYWIGQYIEWSKGVFGRPVPPMLNSQEFKCFASFDADSRYGQIALKGLFEAELAYCEDLIEELRNHGVPGDIAEFGIYQGAWVNRLFELTERLAFQRNIWGFDSFEGLSEPVPDADTPYWKKGMFAAGFDEVHENVGASRRPRIKLVKGWFSDSLTSPVVAPLQELSFVRIDCDIYQPCLECLNFVGPRLSHGSVLVFDDWSHDIRVGEARAFAEWVPTVPHLEFEFGIFGPWDHLYLRVWHTGKLRF